MQNQQLATRPEPLTGGPLVLCPVTVNAAYAKEWDATLGDFLLLTRNGEVLRDTLYRVGGMGTKDVAGKPYFILLKHIESFYPADIIRMSRSGRKDGKHLASHACILDHLGNERVVCNQFAYPYLVKNSAIYSIEGDYSNIETGENYGKPSKTMETTEYLFLDFPYHKDEARRGVLKINKKNNASELFPA